MNLEICSFASSSSGNSFLIRSENTNILLDVGITMKKMDENLAQVGITYDEIDGILITHDHSDHTKCLSSLIKRRGYSNGVYATAGTCAGILSKTAGIGWSDFSVISGGEPFQVGDIEIGVFSVSHDTQEPVGFTFTLADSAAGDDGGKIGVITDTGCIDEDMFAAIKGADVLVIEANHERNILLYGRYPYPLKQRILGDQGHLSNEVTGQWLVRFMDDLAGAKVPQVVLAHLSTENNTPKQAFITVSNILEEKGYYIGKNLFLEVAKKEGLSGFYTT